jgi:hypothetical protein
MVKKVASSQKNGTEIKLKPIDKVRVRCRIVGTSPHIQHNWAAKSIEMMRDKHAGKKSKDRSVRDPEAEGRAALYLTEDGKYGVNAMAVKRSIIDAAHKDIGLEKTLVRKAMFLECRDRNMVIPMDCEEPEIREDTVRVGQGSTDLRYRPYFFRWSVELSFIIDRGWLQTQELINLIDRAGFGVGIGDWRPEKNGDFGRYELDRSFPVTEEQL